MTRSSSANLISEGIDPRHDVATAQRIKDLSLKSVELQFGRVPHLAAGGVGHCFKQGAEFLAIPELGIDGREVPINADDVLVVGL